MNLEQFESVFNTNGRIRSLSILKGLRLSGVLQTLDD